jgi:hypothetical protein
MGLLLNSRHIALSLWESQDATRHRHEWLPYIHTGGEWGGTKSLNDHFIAAVFGYMSVGLQWLCGIFALVTWQHACSSLPEKVYKAKALTVLKHAGKYTCLYFIFKHSSLLFTQHIYFTRSPGQTAIISVKTLTNWSLWYRCTVFWEVRYFGHSTYELLYTSKSLVYLSRTNQCWATN